MSWKSEANARLVEEICQGVAYRGKMTDRLKSMMGRAAAPSTPVTSAPVTSESRPKTLQEQLKGIHNCIADSPIDDLFGFMQTMTEFEKMKPTVSKLKDTADDLLPDSTYKTEAMKALKDVESAKSLLCINHRNIKKVKEIVNVCEEVVKMFSTSFLITEERVTTAFVDLNIEERFENHQNMNWTFLEGAANTLVKLREALPTAVSFFQENTEQLDALLDKISEFSEEAIRDMISIDWNTLKVSRACRNKVLGEYDAHPDKTHTALVEMFPDWSTSSRDPKDSSTYRPALVEFLNNMTVLQFMKGVNNEVIQADYFSCPDDHMKSKPGSMQQQGRQEQRNRRQQQPTAPTTAQTAPTYDDVNEI